MPVAIFLAIKRYKRIMTSWWLYAPKKLIKIGPLWSTIAVKLLTVVCNILKLYETILNYYE
jgi:hypothetical protein